MKCPDPETLRQFAVGSLPEQQLDEIGQHVSGCDICSEFLDQPVEDGLLQGLRGLSSSESQPSMGLSFEQLRTLFAENTRYRLIREIGSGGMGMVCLAHHAMMNREVAVKFIRQDLTANPQTLRRFHQEVQSAARLSHRNVVTAHDADRVGDVHFLVMEFVEGTDLGEIKSKCLIK